MSLYEKKPSLSDFGLTKAQVDNNLYAKKNRQRIISENFQIEENAKKYGVTAFVISFIFTIIIGAASGMSGGVGVILLIVSIIIGVVTNQVVKSNIKQVPTYSQAIDDKYNKYLKALEQWELHQTKSKQTPTMKKLSQPVEKSKSTKSTSKSQSKTDKNKQEIAADIDIAIPQQEDSKVRINQDYQVGMIVKHNMFGVGKVVKVSDDKKEIYVKFDDSLKYKMFLVDIAKFEILDIPKPKLQPAPPKAPTISIEKPVEIKKPEISITYPVSHIALTKEQEQIFNQMLDISLKFCVDLQVDDRTSILGVGLKEQEKLRYYLSERAGKIYVKFTDVTSPVLLDIDNKSKLFSLTREVNNRFEENPEKYQLYKYRAKQEENPQISDSNEKVDIFDIDEEISQLPTSVTPEVTQHISYNNSIFEIDDTRLIRCVGVSKTIDYEIPNGITIIEENAFLDNKFLHNLTIPETVTTIKDQAFKNCPNLKNLVLPSSITSIGKNVFDGCQNLDTLFCQTKAVKKLLTDLPKHIEIVCLEF